METAGSGFTTRKRNLPMAIPHGQLVTKTVVPGQIPGVTVGNYPVKVVGNQKTESRDNLYKTLKAAAANSSFTAAKRRHIRSLDVGSGFYTVRHYTKMSHKNFATDQPKLGFTTRSYKGPLVPGFHVNVNPTSAVWPSLPLVSKDYLYGLGATAIARCEPTSPSADLAVSLAEIVREGMPTIPFKQSLKAIRERKFSEVAGEHLNMEFAVKPLISEVRKFAQAVIKSDEIMRQYDRDSGRVVRRRYVFPQEVTVEELSRQTGQGCFPALPTPMYLPSGNLGTLVRTRTTRVDTWFSGAFTYRVPYATIQGQTSFARDAARARKLLGLRLDAEVLWNLAPWSWFVDWFVSAGQVIHNLEAFATDSLVMQYGYLMQKVSIEDTYSHSGLSFLDGPTGEIQFTLGTVSKTRVKAHPYGFGVLDADLTSRQMAILAAIGISGSRV